MKVPYALFIFSKLFNLLLVTLMAASLVACGGGGGEGNTPAPVIDPATSQNTKNIIDSLDLSVVSTPEDLTKANYVDIADSLVDMSAVSLAEGINLEESSLNKSSRARVDRTERCSGGGTVDIVKNIFDGQILHTGNEYNYNFKNCNENGSTANGGVRVYVNNFEGYSPVRDHIPLGKSTTTFQNFSIENAQVTNTIDGSLVFEASDRFLAIPGGPLQERHETTSMNIMLVALDKNSGKSTSIDINNYVNNVEYRLVGGTTNDYTYHRSLSFDIDITLDGVTKHVEVRTLGEISGDVKPGRGIGFNDDFYELPPESGTLEINIDGKVVKVQYLGDGKIRYTYDEDGDGNSDDETNVGGGTAPPPPPGEQSLEGVWVKACGIGDGEDPADPDAFYDVVTVTFTTSNFDSDIKNYEDASCGVPFTIAPNPTAKGTFTVGDTITTTGGLQATELDTHISEFNGAPFDIDDFGIFYINVDTMYLGDTSGAKDGTTPALRPDTLNFNRAFIRQ